MERKTKLMGNKIGSINTLITNSEKAIFKI